MVQIGAVILSGGLSERMNFPKQFLLIDGVTFVQKIVDTYGKAGIKNICVVMSDRFCTGEWKKYTGGNAWNGQKENNTMQIVANSNPESGRFHSLKLGVEKMNTMDFCFIQNVDNPFVTEEMITVILKNKFVGGYVSPSFKGEGGHPVLLSRKILDKIRELPDGDLNLSLLLKSFKRKKVEVKDERILWNINTQDDYSRYIRMNEIRTV